MNQQLVNQISAHQEAKKESEVKLGSCESGQVIETRRLILPTYHETFDSITINQHFFPNGDPDKLTEVIESALKEYQVDYQLDDSKYKIICTKQTNISEYGNFKLEFKIKLFWKEDTEELVLQFSRINGRGFDYSEEIEKIKS